ncbi:hypothetical protein ACFFX0_10230 [Citricoccus parietis]|uniref:Uncharacterized protein n=1 Tax=Citricoccus parietis TaxID=592307 RepID=A0ABV5FY38_9MICC
MNSISLRWGGGGYSSSVWSRPSFRGFSASSVASTAVGMSTAPLTRSRP